jgi:hypothetical protein
MTGNLKHVHRLLQDRQTERDALLASVGAALRAEQRVVAAWLAGSLGRGDADALSDLDLWVIVRDEAIDAIAADPRAFVAGAGEPCLVIEAPQNAPPGGAYLFTHFPGDTGAHQVDWYWQAASRAARPPTTELLFERISIPGAMPPSPLADDELAAQLSALLAEFWASVLIAAKTIARGRHRSVHRNFEYLDQFERTMRWLLDHGAPPGFDDLRRSPLPDMLPTSAEEQLRYLDACMVKVEGMEPEIERRGVALPIEAKCRVRRWLEFVGSISTASS